MACNWLMMSSSGDDNGPSGSLGLLNNKKICQARLYFSMNSKEFSLLTVLI